MKFILKFTSVIIGLIYLQIKEDTDGAADRNGLLFILMLDIGYVFIFPILNVSQVQIFKSFI